jgi:hypothetical protein
VTGTASDANSVDAIVGRAVYVAIELEYDQGDYDQNPTGLISLMFTGIRRALTLLWRIIVNEAICSSSESTRSLDLKEP